MTTCVLLKMLKESSDGYTALIKVENEKPRVFHGNIPYFPNGSVVKFEFNGSLITDYDFILSERNTNLLRKNNIDVDTFEAKIKLQKKKNFKWYEMYDIENPYRAYDFPIADNLAFEIGLSKDCKERVSELVKYAREKIRSKNIEKATLENVLNAYDTIERFSPFDDLSFSEKMDIIFSDDDYRFEKNKFVDVEIETANSFISNNIESRNRSDYFSISKEEIDLFLRDNHTLDSKQRSAVYELNNNKISVICGNAGTGKTFTIKAILDCYANHRSRDNILCLAPTGKASRRITEESGYPAKTIHSALKLTPSLDRCDYNQQNPLPYELVIVDESSMIDTLLMYRLLNACSFNTKLIFVGDDKQLPPVGCGRPFEKFLNTCSVVKLDRIFRQEGDSGILKNSYRVLQGQDLVECDDFRITNIKEEEINDVVKRFNENEQLIVPYNKLRKKINSVIQKNDTDARFVVGDKVVALNNTFDYCNGDIGYIKKINKRNMIVTINGKDISVEEGFYHHFDLAYALTVHKMQGSEADNIIVFLPKEKNPFITEEMLYTAFTRAKKSVQVYYYA